VLPVLPPTAALVPLDGGVSPRRTSTTVPAVINRNNRLGAARAERPDIIVRNEKRMLQESVDALLDNGRRGRAITGTTSAAQVARRHDQGQAGPVPPEPARQARRLLGPLGDRGGPTLRLHQCGLRRRWRSSSSSLHLPEAAAARRGDDDQGRQAHGRARGPEVWTSSRRSSASTRAPEPRPDPAPPRHPGLRAGADRGKAIQLHPLVCTAFNADFDATRWPCTCRCRSRPSSRRAP